MMMNSNQQQKEKVNYLEVKRLYHFKMTLLLAVIFIDILVNSSIDQDAMYQTSRSFTMIGFSMQIIMIILVFFTFFLLMSGTYVFRVGLTGQLSSFYVPVAIVSPLYLILTSALGIYRQTLQAADVSMVDRWEHNNKSFYVLFVFQKLFSVIFYVVNLRVGIQLGEPIFYTNEPWMRLYRKKPSLFMN
eukprot:g2453.t1